MWPIVVRGVPNTDNGEQHSAVSNDVEDPCFTDLYNVYKLQTSDI
jgi:hypothetical protein